MESKKRPSRTGELTEQSQRVAKLLLDRLPADYVRGAEVLLSVLQSQEVDHEPWFPETDLLDNISLLKARLLIQARDLLFRSFWFADKHTLSLEELRAIFRLSGIHDQHLTNPIAKAIHQDPGSWSSPQKGYQDQVHQRYLGPGWVIDELDIHFSETDLRQLVYTMLHQSGELVEERSLNLNTLIKLSPSLARKIKRLLS